MAKSQCSFFVTFFIAYFYLQSASKGQTAQLPSEIIHVLNSYSKPLNLTTGRNFLAKVQDSEVALCRNLTNNDTHHKTSMADASLASLHVRITNYTNLKTNVLQFPCVNCPNLTSTSPTAKFALKNETVANVTCLAGSRFADDFQVIEQSLLRLTDVLSLSMVDGNMSFVNLSEEESVHLEMPLVRQPNTSRTYNIVCVNRPHNAQQWSHSLCTTNQTLKLDNQTYFVQCNCSALGYYAVFIQYSDSPNPWNWNYSGGDFGDGDNAVVITGPHARLSLSLDADCVILSNSTTKADFLNTTKYSIALALNVSTSNIISMVASCGSIVVNFTLLSPDDTNGTLTAELVQLSELVGSDTFKVPVDNTNILPLTLNFDANYNLTIPTRIVSLYYIRKTATTPTVKTEEIQPLVVDYTPFIISVAVILVLIVACVCGTCCAHSWYLSKKKFTVYNSDRVKPKVKEPVVEEGEVPPPEFPMTFTERPKVDERQMAKYDWARTSFAQEQGNTSAFLTGAAATGPKLIMDCDSDDESDSPHPSGDVAIVVEETEESESSGGSEETTSEEDEDDYDPRNHECGDNFVEGEGQSRASLSRTEEEIELEGQDEEHENEERQEGDEEKEVDDKQTEEERSDKVDEDTDDKQHEEESHDDDINNDDRQDDDIRDDDVRDNDVKDGDVRDGDVSDNDVKDDDVRDDDVRDDDVRDDDVKDDDVRDSDVKDDDVRDDDVKDDDVRDDDVRDGDVRDDDVRDDDIRDDDAKDDDVRDDDVRNDDDEKHDSMNDNHEEETAQRAPTRSDSSSKMDGVMNQNGGMPEPCM